MLTANMWLELPGRCGLTNALWTRSLTAQRSRTMLRNQEETVRSRVMWVGWVVGAAFGCYFCMYGFRKPYTAGTFAGTELGGVPFKAILVSAQVAGYMLSKFLGIRVISELAPQRRGLALVGLVLLAQLALVLFGLVPRPWNAVCMFLNGLPLGMVFGLVMGYLEGRRVTELLSAGLCASFIVADGAAKSVGSWLLAHGVSEDWMPSAAGGLFLLPYAAFVALLGRIEPPSASDVQSRHERKRMNAGERRQFLSRHWIGLLPLVVVYFSLTVVRSIRADFSPEIWRALGSEAVPSVFTHSESVVACVVLAINGALAWVVNNRRAFQSSLAVCWLGGTLLAVALIAHQAQAVSGYGFMVLTGLGLYLPYVAMHTTVFERLLAMTRERGNIGFLMYVADSCGYLGYVGIMLVRNFVAVSEDILWWLIIACWSNVAASMVCLWVSGRYFGSLSQERGP